MSARWYAYIIGAALLALASNAVTHIGGHIQLSTVREFLARHKRDYVLE